MKKLILGIALLGILGSNQARANDGISIMGLASATLGSLLTSYSAENMPYTITATLAGCGLAVSTFEYYVGLNIYNKTHTVLDLIDKELQKQEIQKPTDEITCKNSIKEGLDYAQNNLKKLRSNVVFCYFKKMEVEKLSAVYNSLFLLAQHVL